MIKLGLTGVIGSGKSTVSAMFTVLGAVHIDADKIAREVVEPGGPAYDRVVREFGEGVLYGDGRINRLALADIVFSDPEKRELLESIVHPAVFAEEERLTKEAVKKDPDAVIVFDAALLIESGAYRRMDLVIVVACDRETRFERLISKGADPKELERREAAQMPLYAKTVLADYVIDNSGSIENTKKQVERIYGSLVR